MHALRLLIVRATDRMCVCGVDRRVPSIEVPPRARAALYLTRAIRERWAVDLLCLRIDPRGIAWMEAVVPDASLPAEWRWTKRENVRDPEIRDTFKDLDDYDAGRTAGPFARVGWLREFYAWAEPYLPAGSRFTGRFEQWNPGPTFCLVRFDLIPGGAVWLKAVGDPNLREFSVTPALAARHPGSLPRVLATHDQWHAMLLEHVDAPRLSAQPDGDGGKEAARSLATIQIDWCGRTAQLLSLGCTDCRLERLSEFVEPFFERMASVFAGQSRTPPDRLSSHELKRLASDVRAACSRLAELGIADSIGNGDFSPHNILYRSGRAVFIDWAASYVGQPFLTFDTLRHRLGREHPEHGDSLDEMTRIYAAMWGRVSPRAAIEEALDVAPAIAPLVCAFLCANETGKLLLDEPRHPLYRSLIRLIQRELQVLAASEVH